METSLQQVPVSASSAQFLRSMYVLSCVPQHEQSGKDASA